MYQALFVSSASFDEKTSASTPQRRAASFTYVPTTSEVDAFSQALSHSHSIVMVERTSYLVVIPDQFTFASYYYALSLIATVPSKR
jgi:hypothetical protein